MGNNVSFSTRVRGEPGELRMIQNANERTNSLYVCTRCALLRTDRGNVPCTRGCIHRTWTRSCVTAKVEARLSDPNEQTTEKSPSHNGGFETTPFTFAAATDS